MRGRQVTLTHRGGPWVEVGRRAVWRMCLQSQLTMEARMGRKSVVVATLLVHSVKVATRRQRTRAMAGAGMDCSGVSLFPSHCDRPESWGQRRVVCERLGYLGSQCRLLRLWDSPCPHLSRVFRVQDNLGGKVRSSWNEGASSLALEEQLGMGRRVRQEGGRGDRRTFLGNVGLGGSKDFDPIYSYSPDFSQEVLGPLSLPAPAQQVTQQSQRRESGEGL